MKKKSRIIIVSGLFMLILAAVAYVGVYLWFKYHPVSEEKYLDNGEQEWSNSDPLLFSTEIYPESHQWIDEEKIAVLENEELAVYDTQELESSSLGKFADAKWLDYFGDHLALRKGAPETNSVEILDLEGEQIGVVQSDGIDAVTLGKDNFCLTEIFMREDPDDVAAQIDILELDGTIVKSLKTYEPIAPINCGEENLMLRLFGANFPPTLFVWDVGNGEDADSENNGEPIQVKMPEGFTTETMLLMEWDSEEKFAAIQTMENKFAMYSFEEGVFFDEVVEIEAENAYFPWAVGNSGSIWVLKQPETIESVFVLEVHDVENGSMISHEFSSPVFFSQITVSPAESSISLISEQGELWFWSR